MPSPASQVDLAVMAVGRRCHVREIHGVGGGAMNVDSGAKITPLLKWLALQAVIADLGGELPSAVVVAAKLLDHHNRKTGQCNPSYKTLSKATGLHRRTVIDAVALLERRRWYKVERTSREDSKGMGGLPSNDFKFDWSRIPSEENSTTLVQTTAL